MALGALLAAAVLGAGIVTVGDGIPDALTGTPGDAARGRAIVGSRQQGLCLLCHSGPASADFAQPQLDRKSTRLNSSHQ